MKIEYLLFSLCLLLITWGYPKIGFIKRSGLTTKEIRLLLAFKIVAGLLFAYYFKNFSTNHDYTIINQEGYLHYQLLINDSPAFFNDLLSDAKQYGLHGVFETTNSFWGYLRFILLYKGIAVFDMVTHGNFYLNTALFCSLVFIGHLAFFRTYYSIYKAHKWKIAIACFGLPSVLLYTACIHKDGITFFCIGLISYVLYQLSSRPKSMQWRYLLILFFSMFTIFLFRNYVLVALLPAMLLGIISVFSKWRKRTIFFGCYLVFIAGFFMTGWNHFPVNLPAAVIQRKADFASLEGGNTTIQMNELDPTPISFLRNAPQAVSHSLFRPYTWEFRRFSVLLAALELLFYQLLLVLFIIYRKKEVSQTHPFNIFALSFFINMMLIIGYTIPNIGAIVRYRSIFWILLICPLLCNIDWNKLLAFLKPRSVPA